MAATSRCCKNHHHHPLLPSLVLTTIKLSFFLILPSVISLSFNYNQFIPNDPTLNLQADVYYDNGSLQLTKFERDSLGRVTYYKNLHLWDNTSGKVTDFSSHFSFIINSPNKSTNLGDGITFFLAPPGFPLPVPRDGSGIGLVSRRQLEDQNYTNQNPFVAVEFDTFPNDWDPPYDHVGIDVKSISTAYTTEWYSIKDGRKYDAVVSYNSSSFNLSVSFPGYQNNTKVEQGLFQIVNLTDILPEWVEFGFSSATGDFFEIHTLCSWSFNSSLDMEDQSNQVDLSNRVDPSNHVNKRKIGLIAGLSIGGVVLICGMSLIWLVTLKIRRRRRRSDDGFDFDLTMDNEFKRSMGPKRFPYKQLLKATNKFAKEQKLGEGGFGAVYKGFIEDLNSYVAIKKVSQGSRQGVKEYASEVKIISQLRHKNLVRLLGWCHENDDLILVYELMENGSLNHHLFKPKTESLLTWEARYNIVQGLASALLYLHEEWEQCVVHRDIKASNIMLDSNFNTKLGDFGLARLVDHGKGSKTTVLAGTLGYMAPEYATKGKAGRESDVYSFGIVALEIACGRKQMVAGFNEEESSLVDWVWELYSRNSVLEAADQRLCGDFNGEEMMRLMMVGLWCAHPDYVLRPSIRQVVQVLNFEAPLPILQSTRSIPTNNSSFVSALSSSSSDSGIKHKQSNSSFTGSSQSSTSFQVISPSATLLHKY